MKNKTLILIAIILIITGCKKETVVDIPEDNAVANVEEQAKKLNESNQAFINSNWVFNATGDALKDRIIGVWLSYEVSYDDTICSECNDLFTWVFESTGKLTKRNNSSGSNNSGEWNLNAKGESIIYQYKVYPIGGIHTSYKIYTDTVYIKALNENNLWTSHLIGYPPSEKLDIKFIREK